MAKKTDLAWVAGIVDGEGCISIIRHPPTPGSRCRSNRYTLHVKVTMGHKSTISRLVEVMGVGTLQNHAPRGPRTNASYSWIAQARHGEQAIRLMRPYLLTKAKEADVALAFMALPLAPRGGRGGSQVIPAGLQRKRSQLYWRLRRLKPRWRFRRPGDR
jgi:hypothetical protein